MPQLYDMVLAYAFIVALAVIYIVVPLVLAYYLWRHKFMSDRIRHAFALVLVFSVLFTAFLIVLDLI